MIEYEVELERCDGTTDQSNATFPPSLTKGQRLKVLLDSGTVSAEVIEVTQLPPEAPYRWKLFAREVAPPTST
jgi:hypothetical protein